MQMNWHFLAFAEHDGPMNMGIDAALLAAPPDFPVFRLYGWNPGCISLGRFQAYADSHLLPAMTRRVTGGGAIDHAHELTYSIVGRIPDLGLSNSPDEAYRRFHDAWIAAIEAHFALEPGTLFMDCKACEGGGTERFWCFSRRTSFDVLGHLPRSSFTNPSPSAHLATGVDDLGALLPPVYGKVIGSAQRKRGGVLLQHGSIKLKHSALWPWALSIEDLIGRPIHIHEEAAPLASRFAQALNVTLIPMQLSVHHQKQAEREAQQRFAQERWIRRGRTAAKR